jgi:hypothetical protein
LLGISQGFFSFFSSGFCWLSSLFSRNLGSIDTLPSLYRSPQLGLQSRYTSTSRGQGDYNTKKETSATIRNMGTNT